MTQDQRTYQRGATAAMIGLGVQTAVTLGLFFLGWMTSTAPLLATTWYAAGGIVVWACLWVLYQQHRIERLEALEAEQLAARHGADSSIFEVGADDLSVARRRLRWLYRWFLPAVSILVAVYLIAVGVWLVGAYAEQLKPGVFAVPGNPLGLVAICGGMAVVAFLFSRYIAGMARHGDWAMLRGGSAYLMGVVLVLVVIALALVAARSQYTGLLRYAGVGVPVFMMLIGAEFILNFILEIYRPRKHGELPRPAFDSRVLGLLTAPDSLATTINEAINYQFGFEVTRSWFWQLLSKAFIWLVGFGVIVLLAASCLVVVEPTQRAIVTNFGRLAHDEANPPHGPGIHFKLPWPLASARYYDVTSVRVMRLGSAQHLKPDVPILWDNPHYEGESTAMLVAPPRDGARPALIRAPEPEDTEPNADQDPPPNFLVNIEVVLHYRPDADRLVQYVRANADAELRPMTQVDDPRDKRTITDLPDSRLRALADQHVARYLLKFDIDEWIGKARVTAGGELADLIQRDADAMGLGVRVLDVTVASVHPPQDVADAFHELVGAEQERLTKIESAYEEATKTLARVAGSKTQAERIVAQIAELDAKIGAGADAAAVIEQEQRIAALIQNAGGEAAVLIAQARAERWQMENQMRGRALRFAPQVAAFKMLPSYYPRSQYLRVLAEGLADARKYVLIADTQDLKIRADLSEQSTGFEGGAMRVIEEKTNP